MDIVQLVQENMLDYAGAVNQARAIPDARTGLKPIHRKILYEMYADKIKSDGKFKKCAYMVGQIIARFSEHGDAATYDALVRLGQQWIQRYPVIDFHGNNGSQFGDGPAAMRYTEAKLSKLAEQGFLSTLKKDTVEWIPNFTNEEEEPSTFPAIFPGLFCMPNQGMGYGAACHFVTYNLKEVADLIIHYINNNEMNIIYPDFASGGVLINPNIAEQIQTTGKGSYIIDSKYIIKGQTIVITEIPFNVSFDDIMDEIYECVEKEEIQGINALKNDSGNGQLKMIIEVKTGFNPETIINNLFLKTKLRNSYPVNQVALVDGQPKLLSMEDMIKVYISHNTTCIRNEFQFDFGAANTRIEILEGLTKALEDIDNIIKLIKESPSAAKAKEKLTEKYSFTQPQVDAILNMKLSRLANMEKLEVEDELREKKEFALRCKEIIDSPKRQQEIVVERLRGLAEKFGDERRTEITQKTIVKTGSTSKAKQTIVEDVMITYSDAGYIQNIPIKSYKANSYRNNFKCRTDDMILLFSSLGKLYRIKVDSIKQCGPREKGTAVGALLNLEPGEKILNVFSMNVDEKHPYITGITKKGMIKKADKTVFVGSTQNKNGLRAAGLNEGDTYLGFWETNGDYITLITEQNMAIQFKLDEVRPTGKTGKGVIAMKLAEGDFIRQVSIAPQVNKKIVLQKRAGKGSKIE